MERFHKDLCMIIGDLEATCGNLEALRERAEAMTPQMRVDDYYKILLAVKGTKEIIESLGTLKSGAE